jgi:hypothetical protein
MNVNFIARDRVFKHNRALCNPLHLSVRTRLPVLRGSNSTECSLFIDKIRIDSSSLHFDLFGRIRTCSLSLCSCCCDRSIPKGSESFVVALFLLLLQQGKFVYHHTVVLVKQANHSVHDIVSRRRGHGHINPVDGLLVLHLIEKFHHCFLRFPCTECGTWQLGLCW